MTAQTRARSLTLAPKILVGRTEGEAVADLGSRVRMIADRARVRLERSSRLADSTRAGRLHRLTVRTELEGDTRGVIGMLGGLAREKTVLIVSDLRIVAPESGSPSTRPEVLRVELTVRGWYLTSEGRP